MAKSTGNRVSIERWNVNDAKRRFSDGRVVVTKIAVRDARGRFLSATNYKGTFIDR